MSKEMFVYDNEAVEKVLLGYDNEEFKTIVRNAMKIMEGGQVSAAEMIEVIEKVQLQANEYKKAE